MFLSMAALDIIASHKTFGRTYFMTILYFTATGNSLAVAKRLGGTLLSIPQLIREDDLRQLVRLKPDGIITNRPDILMSVLNN